MQPDAHLSDGVASRLEAFADDHDIRTDHAYELLISVGLEVLDGVELDAYVEEGQLILECERCAAIFDSTGEYLAHEDDHH